MVGIKSFGETHGKIQIRLTGPTFPVVEVAQKSDFCEGGWKYELAVRDNKHDLGDDEAASSEIARGWRHVWPTCG